MIPAFIAEFLGAKAIKAIAGGLATSAVAGAFTNGFTDGLVPAAHDLGLQVGLWAGSFVVGHLTVWFSPKNKD